MKNLLVYYDPDLTATLEDIPPPTIGDNEVLIKVHTAASNPKDWKHPMPNYFNNKLNQGDDCAGTIEAMGAQVKGFAVGDKIAGFHEMDTPRGTYAELAVCPAHTLFRIPDAMAYDEAATVPLAAFTAAVGLFRNLELPMPFGRPDSRKVPLVINGASGAVGAFAIKFAALNPSIEPVVAIAGSNGGFAKELGAHVVLDYRSAGIKEELSRALGGRKIRHVLDCVNSSASIAYLTPVLDKDEGRYTCTTGITDEQKEALKSWGGWFEQIWVGSVHDDKPAGGKMFGAVISKIIEIAMAEGKFTGHPYEVVPGGLNGVKDALIRLRDRKGGNTKFVYRISET